MAGGWSSGDGSLDAPPAPEPCGELPTAAGSELFQEEEEEEGSRVDLDLAHAASAPSCTDASPSSSCVERMALSRATRISSTPQQLLLDDDEPYDEVEGMLAMRTALLSSALPGAFGRQARLAAAATSRAAVLAEPVPVVTALNPAVTAPSTTSVDKSLCVEVRLTPMQPKASHRPSLLATGLGNLFMAPCEEGVAMLQWSYAETALKVPEGLNQPSFEDIDAAPSGAVPLPGGVCGKVSAVLVDEATGSMWTGHKGRKVCRWSISPGQGAVLQHSWHVSATSHILALAVSPWGELWTGTEKGAMRVWGYPHSSSTNAPLKIADCKRPSGARPHDKVRSLAASSTGSTVWSVGRNGRSTRVLIWHAHTLRCLGSLPLRTASASSAAAAVAEMVMDELDVFEAAVPVKYRMMVVDTHKGLDPKLLQRPSTPRKLKLEPTHTSTSTAADAAFSLSNMLTDTRTAVGHGS